MHRVRVVKLGDFFRVQLIKIYLISDRQQYIRFQKSQKVLNHSTLLSTNASSTSRPTPTSCFEGLVQTEHSHKASQGEAIYVYGEKKKKFFFIYI